MGSVSVKGDYKIISHSILEKHSINQGYQRIENTVNTSVINFINPLKQLKLNRINLEKEVISGPLHGTVSPHVKFHNENSSHRANKDRATYRYFNLVSMDTFSRDTTESHNSRQFLKDISEAPAISAYNSRCTTNLNINNSYLPYITKLILKSASIPETALVSCFSLYLHIPKLSIILSVEGSYTIISFLTNSIASYQSILKDQNPACFQSVSSICYSSRIPRTSKVEKSNYYLYIILGILLILGGCIAIYICTYKSKVPDLNFISKFDYDPEISKNPSQAYNTGTPGHSIAMHNNPHQAYNTGIPGHGIAMHNNPHQAYNTGIPGHGIAMHNNPHQAYNTGTPGHGIAMHNNPHQAYNTGTPGHGIAMHNNPHQAYNKMY